MADVMLPSAIGKSWLRYPAAPALAPAEAAAPALAAADGAFTPALAADGAVEPAVDGDEAVGTAIDGEVADCVPWPSFTGLAPALGEKK